MKRYSTIIAALSGALLMGALGVAGIALAAPPTKLTGMTCTAITNVALSTTSESVIAANTARKAACITNNDSSIAIHIAQAATATTAFERVTAGQSWCIEPTEGRIFQGAITAIAASGTPSISGSECE